MDKTSLLENFNEFVVNVQIENRAYITLPDWLEYYLRQIEDQIQKLLLAGEIPLSYDQISEAFDLVTDAWDIFVIHIRRVYLEIRPQSIISRLKSALRILESSNTHAFRQLFNLRSDV
jgi:hypothetical protein